LLTGDVGRMLSGPPPFEEALGLLGREAVLQPAALCLEDLDSLLAEGDKCHSQVKMLLETCRTFAQLTFLLGSRPWKPQGLLQDEVFLDLEFPVPDDGARQRLWESHQRGPCRFAADVDPGALAGRFRLTPGQIRDAVLTARNGARWRSPADERITMADLYAACRAQSNQRLGALALKVQPRAAWADLVLPREQLGQLREITNFVKYRPLVHGTWGFGRKLSLGRGLSVLFAGPSGTGKTLAAEV